MSIKIPPAALEAGARAIAVDGGIADPQWRFYKDAARACCLAMIEAWEGMIHGKYFAEPSIILPLTEKTDDKA